MSATRWALILMLGIAAAAGGWWWWQQRDAGSPVVAAAPQAPAPAAEEAPPTVDYPVPDAPPDAPALPELADSDRAFAEALSALPGASALADWLIPDLVIRRIVVTVDNLPRDRVALKLRPLKPIGSAFDADSGGLPDTWQIGAANPARYDAAVALLGALDSDTAVALYVRWYSRFQQAYRELGYPDASFNNRLIAVLDHLIATPVVAEPIALVKPRVYWEYADPALESASAGRRLLWRIGSAHAAAVKANLVRLRGRLVAAGATPAP